MWKVTVLMFYIRESWTQIHTRENVGKILTLIEKEYLKKIKFIAVKIRNTVLPLADMDWSGADASDCKKHGLLYYLKKFNLYQSFV
jgi:hypothetical protein